MNRNHGLFLLAALAAVLAAVPTSPDIIYFKSFKQRLRAADAIFVGKVISIGDPTPPVSHYGWQDSYSATFQVKRAWRGVVQRKVTVNVASPSDYSFFPGPTYLVYSKDSLTGPAWLPRLADDPEAVKEIELLGTPDYDPNPAIDG